MVQQQPGCNPDWQLGQPFRQGHYTISDEQGCEYILEKTLGVGGFGITYLAKDKKINQVVIKTLNQQIKASLVFQKLKADFYNEALALAKCHHPHIVRVIKIIHVQEMPCIVMEYIEGKSLAELAAVDAPLTETEAIRYIRQVGEALIEVHSKGWLHRDVKPGNIIIRNDKLGSVLIDFGIARPFIPNSDGTLMVAVTPGFAPIEQYDPDGKHGYPSDVYGLAATLYYVLTGTVPKAAQLRFQTPNDSLKPPKEINPNISNAVNHAIIKGMKRYPQERPQSVGDWLKLLPNPDISRHRRLPPVLIGIAISLLAIGAYMLFHTKSCQHEGIVSICRRLADVPNVPQGLKVKFAGAATFPPLNKLLFKNIEQVHPQFELDYYYSPQEIPSSDTAVKWLIDGTRGDLSFVQTSQVMTQEPFELARKRGFELRQIAIAYNIYAVYVNKQLTPQVLKGLTIEQVRDIFTGRVRNWKELGGPDLTIIPIRLTKQTQGNLTSDFFQEQVMGGQPYGANKKDILMPSDGIRTVSKTPGSISFITASQVVNQKTIRVLPIARNSNVPFVSPCADNTCANVDKQIIKKNYPKELTGNLYVVIKDDDGLHKKAGIAYTNMLLSNEGQELIEKAGFVPLRKP